MRLQLRSIVAAVALVGSLAVGPKARAIDITFDLTPLVGQSSPQSLTSGGYTLQFNYIGPYDSFGGSNTGLSVDKRETFSISKTAGATDLIFKSYTLAGVLNPLEKTLTFNLTGGTGTSTGNAFTPDTTLNYNGSYSLGGSQTVAYNVVNFGYDEIALFKALTFSTVPEPSTYALGAIATGVMAGLARRRKARQGASRA